MTKIITVYNQKGGIGKTTFSINICHALVEEFKYKRVLLVDNDSQANSTFILTGLDDDQIDEQNLFTIYDLMTDSDEIITKDCIIKSKFQGIDILPSSIDHSDTDDAIANEINNTGILLEKLEEVREEYDAIVIDCAPANSRTTKNALIAADVILTPMETSVFSNKGLRNLLKQIGKINKKRAVPALHYAFLSKVNNTRKVVNIKAANTLENMLDNSFIKDRISNLALYSKSFEEGYTAIDYPKDDRGRIEVKLLTKEILEKIENDFIGER